MAYTENLFFGLGLRQLICSGAALLAAVAIYFSLGDRLGIEITSWACVGVAAPLAVLGFYNYNGMTAEQFVWAYIKSTILLSGRRLYHSTNYLYAITHPKGGKAHAV